MRNTLLLTLAAIAGLGLTLWAVSILWANLGVHMSLHGWIAYGLGAAGSVALATGLFYLTFKSAREGYDDVDHSDELSD